MEAGQVIQLALSRSFLTGITSFQIGPFDTTLGIVSQKTCLPSKRVNATRPKQEVIDVVFETVIGEWLFLA